MDRMPSSPRPFVTITEQPAGKQQRFRYLSEVDGARSVGSIPGVNSRPPDHKTYPTIRVHGHQGPFLVLVSLLNPHNNLVHPHSITGSDPRYTRAHGVIYVIADKPEVVFKNIGILCVKGKTEKDVKNALKIRKQKNIDPFEAGFQHIDDHRLIDFTAVRLCFQVFLPGKDWTPADLNDPRKYTKRLLPVASDVVYDAKKINDLKIVYINSCAGSISGGNEMTLLCDKYTGQNPDVVFEDDRGWSQTAEVTMYHKQLAIVFVAPPYRNHVDPNCNDHKVKVYLQQSSERGVQRSQPAVVEYLPHDPNCGPIMFPTPTQTEKSSMTLKQVRIQQRLCLDRSSPEDLCLKRWRPWGRGASQPDPSVTDSEEDRSTLSQNDDLDITPMPPNHADESADIVPLFDPATSELYTHEWISKIDQLGAVNGWSDTVKSYYMQIRLSGIAKVWLSSLYNSENMTWPQWKEKLLEAFPRNRKVDYVELLKEMLAQRKSISEKARYYYNKNALLVRHEMNAKKAYACLIEGLPLQMKTNEHCETPDLVHPKYHIDMRDYPNPPQIHPINLNIADYKLGRNVHEINRTVNLNSYKVVTSLEEEEKAVKSMDDFILLDTYRQDKGSGCCCCKEGKPRVRRYLPNRMNEIRPSCIQRHPRRAVIEPSWHQPCSTLTSSSSSPSMGNPAPDWLTDQKSPVPGNHSQSAQLSSVSKPVGFDIYELLLVSTFYSLLYLVAVYNKEANVHDLRLLLQTPSYPRNKLSKPPPRKGQVKTQPRPRPKTHMTHFDAVPGTCSQQEQTFFPYQIMERPHNHQVLTSPVNDASFEVLDSNNAGQGTNIILPQYEHNNVNPFTANANLNINTIPPYILGLNNVQLTPSGDISNIHKPAVVPACTGIKRTVLERNRAKGDSGELPQKRDKLMSHNLGVPECKPSTSYASNNPFDFTNIPLPHVCNLPAPDEYFPINAENIVNTNDPAFSNKARAINPSNNDPTKPALCSDEVLEQYLDYFDEDQIKDMLSMVKKEEQWYSQLADFDNVILQSANNEIPINIRDNVPSNDDTNLFGLLAADQVNEVSMSEELQRMHFGD